MSKVIATCVLFEEQRREVKVTLAQVADKHNLNCVDAVEALNDLALRQVTVELVNHKD